MNERPFGKKERADRRAFIFSNSSTRARFTVDGAERPRAETRKVKTAIIPGRHRDLACHRAPQLPGNLAAPLASELRVLDFCTACCTCSATITRPTADKWIAWKRDCGEGWDSREGFFLGLHDRHGAARVGLCRIFSYLTLIYRELRPHDHGPQSRAPRDFRSRKSSQNSKSTGAAGAARFVSWAISG